MPRRKLIVSGSKARNERGQRLGRKAQRELRQKIEREFRAHLLGRKIRSDTP